MTARRVKPDKVQGRELEEAREVDPDGRIVVHHRLVDTLGKMLRAGTITQEMHDAARDFQAAFIVANLDPLRALPILRVPGTGREPELTERQLAARRHVHKALEALGGVSSPAGSWVWHVVGLQQSVREWAMRQGWNGRPVRREQAQGILVATLGMLACSRRIRTSITFGAGFPRRPNALPAPSALATEPLQQPCSKKAAKAAPSDCEDDNCPPKGERPA